MIDSLLFSQRDQDDTQDLIRLDSSSDIDDFDPLKSTSYSSSVPNSSYFQSQSCDDKAPMSITNPLYNYENYGISKNGSMPNVPQRSKFSRETQDLLEEYGLNFFPGLSSNSTASGGKVNPPNQWTTFE